MGFHLILPQQYTTLLQQVPPESFKIRKEISCWYENVKNLWSAVIGRIKIWLTTIRVNVGNNKLKLTHQLLHKVQKAQLALYWHQHLVFPELEGILILDWWYRPKENYIISQNIANMGYYDLCLLPWEKFYIVLRGFRYLFLLLTGQATLQSGETPETTHICTHKAYFLASTGRWCQIDLHLHLPYFAHSAGWLARLYTQLNL